MDLVKAGLFRIVGLSFGIFLWFGRVFPLMAGLILYVSRSAGVVLVLWVQLSEHLWSA